MTALWLSLLATMKNPRYFLSTLLLIALSPMAGAHDQKRIAEHPATQYTLNYLRNTVGQDWKKAASQIEENSLLSLKEGYLERRKNAPAAKGEAVALNAVDLGVLEALTPAEFYVRYHAGTPEARQIAEEKSDQIMASLAVKVITLGEESVEGSQLCHILVRKRHFEGTRRLSSLDLISLIKDKTGAWKITLNAHGPLLKPIEANK